MGCEQLVQHAKVSKNRKFIPHFRENLARPLDKGGVEVVYLPCNPQSAASVREVINTANRLIHRVTAEVINPFQQLSTLYRHVVDTSPPLGRTAAPVYSRAAALFHRFTAAPLPGLQLNRSIVARFPAAPLTAAPFYLHRSAVFPPCHSIAVLLFAVLLLCCTEASLSFSRFTAAPLYRCSVSSLYSGIAPPVFPSRLCRFAASPVSAPSARKPFPALCFSFSGMPLPPPFPGCLSARRRLRPATRRPRQRSPRRGGSSPLRTRNPVPHLGSGDSTPGGRIAAPAAQLHRNAGWRGGAPER